MLVIIADDHTSVGLKSVVQIAATASNTPRRHVHSQLALLYVVSTGHATATMAPIWAQSAALILLRAQHS
jgi:hypothetical protein